MSYLLSNFIYNDIILSVILFISLFNFKGGKMCINGFI